ncbi:uncharacterized protein TEOVI_000146200 [Trypanosoma equiperdum]|uniref:Uncharacterized protein n=4 Tax=Trypanozoon TaxID=39700 RepID=Q57UM2_TRYB2|nr:hypothetical protein, conserved [Trypanosoma brucei gambiense DAL972]XP_846015.1 hypothetical protein, conserved [Trypanosoma brucei brucei TREU927]AAX70697.1 hypothetical protein, conserved [Trypanosoma brucei]RHW71705.1 hypothetical protein DPX39_070049400 [Trypanosoma brucei equiperdum]SCU69893.1 hypothetical protein, conserved [Trypanosoma equiperdum]AAZ12456.1 hypothetical protein, conserved [Trypanosoma brucei brucei TREU927]CBH12512.1 hypothetical protein, conserved [Trypanosoma bru|eukprot:XP_011774792.1 hypothetical protein, conserved [Trypanosoma brucei gambiense DAL972]
MTEGRFETIHNLRPKNWDGRRHWTNWHHLYDCEKDHLARESCPFHDLRSGGQFQYENWGGGEFKPLIPPNHLNNRPCGDRMDFSKGHGTQIGGLGDIPLDVEGGKPTQHNKHPGKTVMFTRKDPLKRGLFSSYPYIPEASTGAASAGGPAGPNIKTGKVNVFGQAPEWIADPYDGKTDRGRIFHFKAGPLNYRPDDRLAWMPEGEPERRKKRIHGVFRAGKPCGIINDVEWVPDPLQEAKVKKQVRPFRTWHTRTKWSMPTHAPWSTGKITAEPFRGPNLNITQSGLPCLDTFKRVNMTQTIGKEAALAPVELPGPARLK